ncbi:MAG: betaine/proline/choline family ABC transporter ATP-binding protein [Cohaesibacteraceae bacterium]|nr:betaine/proline/choline family ABC transporter ATP-binding protein [Cohaesibacteraceae bacterium]
MTNAPVKPLPKISCKNIWKLYGAKASSLLDNGKKPDLETLRKSGVIGAVRDVNIDIMEGEIFVIMGLSGSGKSTLVRCLSRLVEPTAGEMQFDGIDLLKASSSEMIEIRRRKMGMVFQQFALLPHLSVLQNVAFPLDIQGVSKKNAIDRALDVIELVGLKGRENYYPRELSGGQQQRVGIARSLAVEPELWFLDEPFSALDPLIRREMQDEFLRLQQLLQKTIVFITHDFDEALRLADRIAIMKDGEIIQVATPENLLLNPATDYVAEFTRHVPRDKVLTVGSIMSQMTHASGNPVRNNARIADIARSVLTANHPLPVIDENCKIVGSIGKNAVLDVLTTNGDMR